MYVMYDSDVSIVGATFSECTAEYVPPSPREREIPLSSSLPSSHTHTQTHTHTQYMLGPESHYDSAPLGNWRVGIR